uniref:AMP-binding domain-containing protein n=1 Tax=Ascaris lumbricoides TaxID=6252 RepID=A0A0M3IMN8_ASCLU
LEATDCFGSPLTSEPVAFKITAAEAATVQKIWWIPEAVVAIAGFHGLPHVAIYNLFCLVEQESSSYPGRMCICDRRLLVPYLDIASHFSRGDTLAIGSVGVPNSAHFLERLTSACNFFLLQQCPL